MNGSRSTLRITIGAAVATGAIAFSGPAWAEINYPPSGSTRAVEHPEVSGRATPGSTVTVYAKQASDQVFGCSVLVPASSEWACTFMNPIPPGTWRFDALEVHPDHSATSSSVAGIVITPPDPNQPDQPTPAVEEDRPTPGEADPWAEESQWEGDPWADEATEATEAPQEQTPSASTKSLPATGTGMGVTPFLLAGTALLGTGVATLIWVGRRRTEQG
ncbi:hypothetical protein [Polymorphospora sp. NPDC050346]|uniref:hypothetical protein n=1 Tax=Polymorphospora sp. NPDC050346 TaxID=3155780 RepID=UPI0033F37C87